MNYSKLYGPTAPVMLQVRGLALIAIASVAYFFVTVVALHFLRPDYDPMRRFVSAYASGPYGFLMTAAFFALAMGVVVLALGLQQRVSSLGRSRVGLILFGIAGVGLVIAGIFPTDVTADNIATTTGGLVHNLAALVSFPLSSCCYESRFDTREKGYEMAIVQLPYVSLSTCRPA